MSFGSIGSQAGRPRIRPGYGVDRVRGKFVNTSAAGAGDILFTFDESSPPHADAMQLDGSTITDGAIDNPGIAARYPWMVSGDDLILPDARGAFPRIWDNTAGVDPDAGSRTARAGDSQTGDYPGTEQACAVADHRHSSPIGPSQYLSYAASYSGADNSTPLYSGGYYGGNETRPINMAFAFWMIGG